MKPATKFVLTLFSATLLLVVSQNTAAAQSLWNQRNEQRVRPYRDLNARNTGDILTVIVNVATDVNNSEQRALNKTTAANASGDGSFGGAAGAGALNADYNTQSNRQHNGNSRFTANRTFSDRFTVKVLDVFPNGNLLIGGRRIVTVQGDKRQILLSGIVRGRDIQADNSISSRLIANLNVRYIGVGPEKNFTRPGWLHRQVTKVWPF